MHWDCDYKIGIDMSVYLQLLCFLMAEQVQ